MTNQLTKYELGLLLQALRRKTKAAKSAILATASKLKADFEIQLKTLYPPAGDLVWNEAFNALRAEQEKCQARITQRCEELGIPPRFRPKINPISWNYGAHHYFQDIRNEIRRLAHYQIDELLKSKLFVLEQGSAEAELGIISKGFVTDAAKDFFAQLPTIEALIPPVKIEEISALLDGRSLPTSTLSGLPLPVLETLKAVLPPIGDEEEE
jgi:hypothetical protein